MAKVLFIQDIAYEYFGVMYMSAYLKANGHECEVLIEPFERKLMNKIGAANPDLVAFSTLSGSFRWSVEMAAQIKKQFNKTIIFGGVHVFSNPDKTIQCPPVDIVCTGEGEIPLKALCDSIDKGEIDRSIEGLWFKTEDGIIKNKPIRLIDDLDSLPFPDRKIYWKYPAIETRDQFPVLGSRGCPYKCSYCFIPSARKIFEGLGKDVRQRSPENILQEIDHCLNLSSRKKVVHFAEDHFGNNRSRTLDILTRLPETKNGKLKWVGSIRIERFIEEEYVEKLSKTNHGILGLAVESGNEHYRTTVLDRETTNEQILKAASLATKYGIKYVTLCMVALPGETYQMALETLELVIKIKPIYAQCFVYQPYPNTNLQEYAVEHKYFAEEISDQLGVSFYDRYDKDNADLQKRISLQRVFALIVKFPKLKPILLKLVEMRSTRFLDVVFGVYFLYYLKRYLKVTPAQIAQYVTLWMKTQFSWENNPVRVAVSQGNDRPFNLESKK